MWTRNSLHDSVTDVKEAAKVQLDGLEVDSKSAADSNSDGDREGNDEDDGDSKSWRDGQGDFL